MDGELAEVAEFSTAPYDDASRREAPKGGARARQPTTVRAPCPVCSRSMPVTRVGALHIHGPLSNRCKGSGMFLTSTSSAPADPASSSQSASAVAAYWSSSSSSLSASSSASVSTPLLPPVLPVVPAINAKQLLATISSIRRKTLTRIPRGARPLAAQVLQKALDEVIADPSKLAPWKHLLCLPYLCLHIPPRDNNVSRSKEKSLTSKVSSNLRNILESLDGDDLVVGRDVCRSNPRVSRRPKDPKSFLADKISEKISEGNIKGAVRLASSDYSLIPPDAETASILRDKHPSKAPSSSSAVTSSPTTPQYHTDESEVLQAIRSFPNGSGGGLDGLKPQHFKDLVGSGGREHESRLLESRLLKSLTHFVNLVLDGCVPQEIRSIFFGASLCALRKKDGGVRPIAIGNTLRRLISKVAVRGCTETCSNLL